MAIFCSSCGGQNPDAATFCAACGKPITHPAAAASPAPPAPGVAPTAASGTPHAAAGAIAYLTFIPALILLLIEPYNRDRFVRFHAWQCIWLTVAAILLRIIILVLPGLFFLHLALRLLVSCLLFIFWLIAIVNAAQGKIFKIPVIGEMAESQAGKI